MPLQFVLQFECIRVYINKFISRAQDDLFGFSSTDYRFNAAVVPLDGVHQFAIVAIPHLAVPILTAGQDLLLGERVHHDHDALLVAPERAHLVALLHVPNDDSLVVRCGYEQGGVFVECD